MKAIVLILHAFKDLIVKHLPRMRKKDGFAFLVHPRNIPDVYRKYPFLKFLPIPALEWFLRHYWPVVLSEVEGLKDKDNKPVRGWVIGVPLTAKQMLENREMAKKKIIQAIKLAEKTGAKIIGLGAFIVSITNGGKNIIDYSKTLITTGNSLMAGITVSVIKDILKNDPNKKLAIIGATTFIGRAVSKLLGENKFDCLILIGKTLEHINELKNEINEVNKPLKIIASVKISDINQADIIIITTSAPNLEIKSEYIKNNAIIYDTAQPKNIPEEILNQRKDIKYIEGGLVKTPGINYHFNFGIEKETAFACLGEVMLLAAENIDNHYSIGDLDMGKIKNISNLADRYNFKYVK